MKICQYYEHDRIRLGAVEDDRLLPLKFEGNMIDFIRMGLPSAPREKSVPIENLHFAPVVSRPSKIIAIGLNYMDHVRESKGKVPETPLVFAKFPNSLIGHGDTITWYAEITRKVDFEAELAVVIGKKSYRCSESEVMDAVFGYTCANDVSGRDLQFGDGQWVRGKSLDTFCPLGPWIVTAEDLPEPHSLGIRCVLNAETMQESSTSELIFKLPRLLSVLSHHFTLEPGDLVLTGTPPGVGAFRDPSVYMKDGDEVIVEIEGIGRLVNTCRVL